MVRGAASECSLHQVAMIQLEVAIRSVGSRIRVSMKTPPEPVTTNENHKIAKMIKDRNKPRRKESNSKSKRIVVKVVGAVVHRAIRISLVFGTFGTFSHLMSP